MYDTVCFSSGPNLKPRTVPPCWLGPNPLTPPAYPTPTWDNKNKDTWRIARISLCSLNYWSSILEKCFIVLNLICSIEDERYWTITLECIIFNKMFAPYFSNQNRSKTEGSHVDISINVQVKCKICSLPYFYAFVSLIRQTKMLFLKLQ